MGIYIKTITVGPVIGGKKAAPDKVDGILNKALEDLQRQGAEIRDVKVAMAPLNPGEYVSTYVIVYYAPQAIA